MQIKTTVRYYFSQNGYHQKNLQKLNAGEDEEKGNASTMLVGL